MKISLFDFDNTLYKGDSSIDFMFYSIRRNPLKLFNFIYFCFHYLFYILGVNSKDNAKSAMFKTMELKKNVICDFWIKHNTKINFEVVELLLSQLDDCDSVFILSASPEKLLMPIVEQEWNQVFLIGTRIDNNSRIHGTNCYGYEKVERLKHWLLEYRIPFDTVDYGCVVSDSVSDLPLYDLGGEPYFVDKGILKHGYPIK